MKQYQITSQAGADFGVWEAESEETAFDAMVEAAGGYKTDVDGYSTAGTISDWQITEAQA